MFCRETVRDHRRASEADAAFPRVIYVHQGTAEQGEAFFEGLWPEAPAIADPDRKLYDAFDLGRGRIGQVFNLRTLMRGVAALLKGNGVGKPVGDTMVMPGLFLVGENQILWAHEFRHAGERPNLGEVPRLASAPLEGTP